MVPPPHPNSWHGTSANSLEEALKDAHQKAAADGMKDKWLAVEMVRVTGDNPIREYSVVLGPGG
jgi:flavin-binding protein dodecin